MSVLSDFSNHMKDTISEASWFSTRGFTARQVAKKLLPQIKDPLWPMITISYDIRERERFANIYQITLFVGIHSEDYNVVEGTVDDVIDALDRHLFADASINIWKCFSRGTPPIPAYNEFLRVWEVFCEFDVAVG